jgi:hypothetical protein
VHPDTAGDPDESGDDRDASDPLYDPADAEADRRVLGWGGPANPNTADGEIQGISAFSDAASRATGWRRTVARLFAWGTLIFIVIYVLVVFGLATKLV